MELLDNMVQRITKWGIVAGSILLIVAMLLQIGNILGRFAHFVIPGSFETFEMIMAIPIGFGMTLAAITGGHVIVEFIISRFPPKLHAAADIVATFISTVVWAALAWAGANMAIENGLEEVTDILEYPMLPFRVIFVFSLILICLTYLVGLFRAFRRFLDK